MYDSLNILETISSRNSDPSPSIPAWIDFPPKPPDPPAEHSIVFFEIPEPGRFHSSQPAAPGSDRHTPNCPIDTPLSSSPSRLSYLPPLPLRTPISSSSARLRPSSPRNTLATHSTPIRSSTASLVGSHRIAHLPLRRET